MATGITITLKADTEGFKRDVKSALDTGSAQVRQFKSAIDSANSGFGSMNSGLGSLKRAFAALGGAFILKEIAEAAVRSAINIDKQVSSLRALTGSAEAATKRFKELFDIAQRTPGLTTNLATTLDAQLRVFKVNEQTINRLLPVIGRVNAIAPLEDPRRVVQNLTQLISQNFDKQDLRELIGASPILAQLVGQIFNVDNPTNAEAIRKAAKKMGVTTVERLAEELIKEAENNGALKNAVETIGGQFDKLKDRLDVALAPVGKEIAKTLIPIFDDIVKKVEEYGSSAARVFAENRTDIITTAKEVTAMTVEIGKLVGKLAEVGARSGVFKLIATSAAVVQDIISDPYYLQRSITQSVVAGAAGGDVEKAFGGPRERAVAERFAQLDREAAASRAVIRMGLTTDRKVSGLVFDPATGRTVEIPANAGILTNNNRGGGNDGTGARPISASRRESAREQAERALSSANIAGLQRNVESRLRDLDAVTDELIKGYKVEIKAREKYSESLQRLGDATSSMVSKGFSNLIRNGKGEFNDANRDSSRAYSLQLQGVDDLFNRGAINPDDAEALRRQAALQRASVLNSNLNGPNAKFIDRDDIQNLRDEAEHMTRLGTAVSEAERFMRGFRSATISVGDAFDRFGQNVAGALTNTKNLLDGLKQALLGFFNDLLGRSIQSVVGQALAPLAQIFGGGVFGGSAGGAGGGGTGGVLGNIFRTPSYAGGQGLQSLAGIGLGAGFGIDVPASVSSGSIGGLPIFRGNITNPNAIASSTGGVIGSAAAQPSFLSGIGNSIAGAAPFIGAGIGSSLGGQSITGQIAGAAGGLLAGGAIGAALTTNVFSATATAFLTNPFTIAAGAGLLVGAYFLGKASQRKKDEEASGQYLTQALQSIDQLALGVQSGQIDGGQARQIFESQILGTFKQQISGLKTKSVVESRLTNQVRDLRKVFEDRIPPLIAEQQRKAADAARFGAIDSRLVPQFASGGFVGGIDRGRDSVMAMLRPGELVLNRSQQASVMAQSSPGVFSRAGVPAINTTGRYDSGGYAMPASGGRSAEPVQITINAVVDAKGIYIVGATSEDGRRVNIKQEREQRLNRER